MAQNLTNIRFKRVALVDKGANFDTETKDGAHILLWKRHTNEEKSMTIVDVIKKMMGLASETDETKRQSEEAALLKALGTPGSPEATAMSGALPIAAPAAQHVLAPAHVAALKQQHSSLGQMIASHGAGPHPDGHPVHALKAAHEQLTKALGACEDNTQMAKRDDMNNEEVKVEISKATVDLQKKLDEAVAANTATTELLKAERNTRLDNDMVILLKSFKATPLVTDLKDEKNDVKKFRKMQDVDPEGFARTIELLKAADEQNATSLLFARQVGSNRGGVAGSAEAQLVAKADAIISKSAVKLTKEQAFEQASLENPELVKQYRQEQQ